MYIYERRKVEGQWQTVNIEQDGGFPVAVQCIEHTPTPTGHTGDQLGARQVSMLLRVL
jgi:hypothetical protein